MTAKYFSRLWLGFIFGVAIGSWYVLDQRLISIIASVGLVMICLGIITRKILLVGCLIAGLIIGAWYVSQSFAPSEYLEKFGQSFETEGVITVDPPVVDHNQQVTFVPDGHSQAIRAIMFQPIIAARADRVWVRGQLEPPENFNDFDYIGYLQRHQVYAVLKKPQIIVLKRASFSWRTPLRFIKQWFIWQSKQRFEQRPGSLVMGMLIGERGNIPEDVTESFARTGLSHVVAVSGFNMTILAAGCASLAWYLGRRNTNYLTILVILSFVVITGATASVVRAAIMALLLVSAQLFGRLYTSGYALLWAAGLMTLQNPRIVAWDVGFQLSVAATAGVLTVYWWQGNKPGSLLKSILLPTLGAIIATAPLIAFYFHTVSLVAPLANALLLPLVPLLMLFGILSFGPVIGSGMTFLATSLANFFLSAVEFLSSWSYSSLELRVSAAIVIIYYLFLFGLVLLISRLRRVVKSK